MFSLGMTYPERRCHFRPTRPKLDVCPAGWVCGSEGRRPAKEMKSDTGSESWSKNRQAIDFVGARKDME